ncbi:MAG: putative transposase, partial [Ilumatobacteraceae bacterium]
LGLALLGETHLLEEARAVYGRLKNGWYGLRSLLWTLIVMALLRVKRPEQIKLQDPVSLGRLLGLPRSAEVKTVRRKVAEVAERFDYPLGRLASDLETVFMVGVPPYTPDSLITVIVEDDRVTGIITESKAGREAIRARRVIDATGDADVAHRAGAPTRLTPREQMMAASVMFHLAGVDKQAFMAGVRDDPQTYRDWSGNGEWNIETDGKEDTMFSPFLHKPFARAVREGLIPDNLATLAGTWGAVHDSGEVTYMNVVHLPGVDGTDPDDLTRGEIEGRRHAMHAVEALRHFTPGCSGARLRNFGMTLGIRDTRKIDAAYDMTEDDVRHEGRFDDTIGIFPEFIDGYGILILPTTGRYFQLPYRNLLPRRVGNLLVAGRSSGGDRVSHAATRNMGCCAVLGQAAGIAAAVSLHRGSEVDDLGDGQIAAVQSELIRQGVRIH